MDQRLKAKQPNPEIAKKFERLEWDTNFRERKTTTDYLANALRIAIYDGQFDDNEELNQVELAEFFGVSRVPVREALRQLQAEGLVQSIAHYRTIVSGMSLSQIIESIEMRATLEAHLLRKASKKLDRGALKAIRHICTEVDNIKDYGSQWVLKNWEFHRALYARSESPSIIDTVERLHLKIERYLRRTGGRERLRQAAAEHRQILNALEQKDFGKASTLLEKHILNSGEVIRWQYGATDERLTDKGSRDTKAGTRRRKSFAERPD
ncbi:GntR family transcriptional regulator [Bradyrhizobium sp. NP1]|uniref:GntR family transcriptional regulator n=1 Tax=Bradyrhizobium sp. NP1 TaxID=3049772 RepID=UPI0025A56A0F|nr:GntR family transcriptional regulator [Bradyrhizobium sp. NP1]WJR76852.1 GntR family transcriptional regulator [Bradyrhizobium sp. NP1]